MSYRDGFIKEFRCDAMTECEHEWIVDGSSGMNYVDMEINQSRTKHEARVKAGEVQRRHILGTLDLRMECELCKTAIWVREYAICDSSTGNPYVCNNCGESEASDNCYCYWCKTCGTEIDDECGCGDDE